MSTSETVNFDIGACPCGSGRIVRSVTTQDNPWSSADVAHGISCPRCSEDWELGHNRLTLKASRIPYDSALDREHRLADQITHLAHQVFEREIKKVAHLSKKAQQAYLADLGLTNYSYRQYLDHLRAGNAPWTVCRWRGREIWLLQQCSPVERDKLQDLLQRYQSAAQERERAGSLIIRRPLSAEMPSAT